MHTLISILFSFLCLFPGAQSLAVIRAEAQTSQFSEVFSELKRQTERFGAGSVLLVLDLDNTILHSRNLLGGYAWYKWQEKMHREAQHSQEGRVAASLEELLSLNGLLFSYGSMELSEPTLPRELARLQAAGVELLCLTSRAPSYWESSLRDLEKNGLFFSSPASSLPELARERDFFSGKELEQRFAFSPELIARYKLDRPARVLLRDGVFFSSGMHKGAMLELLFRLRGRQPKALIFVDDSEGNIQSLRESFSRGRLEVSLFRYDLYQKELELFETQKKAEAMQLWQEFAAARQSRDPKQLSRFLERAFPQ